MADPDFYAYLYVSQGQGVSHAMSKAKYSPRYMPARGREHLDETSDHHSRESREATEQPDESDKLLDSPCIGLKFSDGAKTEHGVVMGWAPDCDVVLPKKKGISRYHTAITFDKQNRLVVRDLGSLCGTKVVYDGELVERGFSMDWVVGGVEFVRDKTPILHFIEQVQFKIVVPPHDIKSQQYVDNVTKFHKGTADAADLIECLGIRSLEATEVPTPTGTSTPLSKHFVPMYWRKELGKGGFGIVTRVFNVTTGEEYAVKEPLKKSKGRYSLREWKKEAEIMSSIQHDHIVALLEAKFEPWPQLYFEYANGGSLNLHPATSDLDEVRYMCQLLSALAAMHARSPSIVHRDIKPDNILCFVSVDGTISVKFADFGLSKNEDELKTFCGTLVYLAPEIHAKIDGKDTKHYTAAVDIWSLAVVFAERQHGLPERLDSHNTSTTAWNMAVLEYFRQQPQGGSELVPFLLHNMLHIEPHMRKPASYCHDQAIQLLDRLSRRQAPARPGDTDSFSSLIADLGYRGSSKIDSIVNPSDDDDDDESTFKRSYAPPPDNQEQPAASQSVVTMVKGGLWVDEQTGHASFDGIIPTIEAQDGAVLESLDLSTRIRRFLGGNQVSNENRETRALEEGDSEKTFKRARLGKSSDISLAPLTEAKIE